MNAYTFDIFVMHSFVLENTEKDGIYATTCELVEIGPLNGPDIKHFESIKTMINDISSTPVIQKCLELRKPASSASTLANTL
jgi:hypothetical protein